MLLSRFLRRACSRSLHPLSRQRLRPSAWPIAPPLARTWTQQRPYMYRVVNHRQVIHSWNMLRLWWRDPLFFHHIASIAGFCAVCYLWNLEPVPISDRLRFNYVHPRWEDQLAKRLFRDAVKQHAAKIYPPTSPEHTAVQRVLDRLTPHATELVQTSTDWEVRVINAPETNNAYVLPGGKVFVYSGLLHLCATEDELATVLAHEVGHSIARHGSERLSHRLMSLPLFIISAFTSGLDPDLVAFLIDITFRLPRSRVQELEADHFGLLVMAEAGYDAQAAPGWWRKMEEAERDEGEGEGPAYLKTHPGHRERFGLISGWIGEARGRSVRGDGLEQDFRSTFYLQRGICGLRTLETYGAAPVLGRT